MRSLSPDYFSHFIRFDLFQYVYTPHSHPPFRIRKEAFLLKYSSDAVAHRTDNLATYLMVGGCIECLKLRS